MNYERMTPSKAKALHLRDTIIGLVPYFPEVISLSDLACLLAVRKGLRIGKQTLAQKLVKIRHDGYVYLRGKQGYTRAASLQQQIAICNWVRPVTQKRHYHISNPDLAREIKNANALYRAQFLKGTPAKINLEKTPVRA
jgi:hypothetical protein